MNTGDKLKFMKDFELTVLQLWSFFKNSIKRLKVYIKVTMQIEAFNDLPKNDQKRLVKRIKKACWTLQDVYSQEFVCGNDKIKR